MREKIQNFIKEFAQNYKIENKTSSNWEEPLVGFANANDALFLELRSAVSETHKLPTDLLKDAETVISYFIPFQKEIALSNAGAKNSSKEWAIAYIETNKLIAALNNCLSQELEKANFKSVILPPTHNFDAERLISDWSHKHIAFIAGLGNFGLHQMLITEKGCCGRLGSLITSAKIEPTKRPNKEFCLYKYDQSCQKCVENCVFGALKVDSFDRHKCYEICLSNAKSYSKSGLADCCGKCACVVPCSFNNPVR
jgi:epoxyqueuosine reductase QueG